jgi:hypothetical protein
VEINCATDKIPVRYIASFLPIEKQDILKPSLHHPPVWRMAAIPSVYKI